MIYNEFIIILDEYHDPVTFKVFTEHTHIVAIATSGNIIF